MSASGEGWYADPHDAQRLRWWSGSEWTDLTTAQVMPTHWGPPLKPSWTRVGTALQLALGAYIAAALFTFYVDLETLSFVEEVRLRPDTVSLEDAERIDALTLWSIMELPTFVIAAVLFIVWLYTLHVSDRMNRLVLEHKSGWAIGGWFVPILALWRPFQMVNDVRRGATGLPGLGATHTQGWWWGLWIASTILTGISNTLYTGAASTPDGPEYVDALQTAASWERYSCVANIAAAVLAILVVRQITALVRNSDQAA